MKEFDFEKEPFYKWYYRQQTPMKKLKLRWNWFKHGNTICRIRTFFDKFKYGWSYDGNPASEFVIDIHKREDKLKRILKTQKSR